VNGTRQDQAVLCDCDPLREDRAQLPGRSPPRRQRRLAQLTTGPSLHFDTLQWRDALRRLRRGLRDVRDRMARRRIRWRDVCFAGMAGRDHTAVVVTTHEGICVR
jgi:hypothetical protein